MASATVSPTPDLEAIRNDLRSNENAALEVTSDLSLSDLNWQPKNGAAWSILQCLEHLALTNNFYIDAAAAAIARLGENAPPRSGPIQPSFLGAFLVKKVEPRAGRRLKAPPIIIPQNGKDKQEVLDHLFESHNRIREAIAAAGALDLNRIRFRNPFIRLLRVRVGTGLLIMAAHERRHLWQARQVRSELAK